jgi:hypothetical protein
MDDRRKLEAIAAARREIARRIARVCTSLSPEEFERLLDRMAGVQWKYDVLPAILHANPPGDAANMTDTHEIPIHKTAEREKP